MVSIIVPVYNVSKYLRICLDSVKTQTFIDWECILIDDGSSDDSGIICDEYSRSDYRFSVYHISNGGVGNARNIGIEIAKGEWLTFIDSDDEITSNYLETLVSAAKFYNPDLVITKFDRESDGENKHFTYHTGLFLRSELGSAFLKQPHQFFYSSCYKLFKKEILKKFHILFKTDISLGEDLIFSASYISCVNSICFINGGTYKYIIHSDSLIQKNKSFYDLFNIHLYLHSIFLNKIMGKFSSDMELFWGKELILTLENSLLSLYTIKNKHEKINILKKLDLKFYKKYKKCVSWKEWIVKQTLIHYLPRTYLYLQTKSLKASS